MDQGHHRINDSLRLLPMNVLVADLMLVLVLVRQLTFATSPSFGKRTSFNARTRTHARLLCYLPFDGFWLSIQVLHGPTYTSRLW